MNMTLRMRRVVTKDEPWVQHWSWGQKNRVCNGSILAHPPKKFKKVSSAGKVMASTFWDRQGVIMVDYLEEGGKINGAYHAEELRQLCQDKFKQQNLCSNHEIHVLFEHGFWTFDITRRALLCLRYVERSNVIVLYVAFYNFMMTSGGHCATGVIVNNILN